MKVHFSRFQHFSNILVIGTGAGFAWTKYFYRSADPFSNAGSPAEPWFHDSHIWVVPLLIFACGLLWQHHIAPMMLRPKPKRRGWSKVISGYGLLIVLIPMVLTGYLIQTTVDEFWRKAWVTVHLVTSAAWSLSYLSHVFLKKKNQKTN